MEGVHKKKTRKKPVVDLDEDDDDDMPGRRNLTRWNKNEEMLLAETWIELAGRQYRKRPTRRRLLEPDYAGFQLSIDEDNLQELFGPDPRERPAGKQRASKKQKSVDTSNAGGSTGGSQSESISSLVCQDYKRKCDAAERAYEAKREKELAIMKKEFAIMQCKELEFLMLDHSSLPLAKRAIIEKKQAEIMKKISRRLI
ncbi:hypothetical protein Tco_0484390 [Tanacetum coccineum]